MNMVREEFKSLRAEINAQKNQGSVDITYKPPVIASIDELNLMEEKLGTMDATFLKDYTLMVRIDKNPYNLQRIHLTHLCFFK